MDKYELKVTLSEIDSLIAKRRLKEAAQLADTVDWRKVRNVRTLCRISDVYKINKRFEDSKRILELAYSKNQYGRQIIFSLCELELKLGNFVRALQLYNEYINVAPRDTDRYVLQYKLYKEQNVSIHERIAVLEEMARHDLRDKWAFELAKLYLEAGESTLCASQCDEIIASFGYGRYVRGALELKASFCELNPKQKELYRQLTGQEPEEPEQGTGPKNSETESSDQAVARPDFPDWGTGARGATGQYSTGDLISGPGAADPDAADQEAAGRGAADQEAAGRGAADQGFADQEFTGQEFIGQEFTGQEFTGQETGEQEAVIRKTAEQEPAYQESAEPGPADREIAGSEPADQETVEPEPAVQKSERQEAEEFIPVLNQDHSAMEIPWEYEDYEISTKVLKQKKPRRTEPEPEPEKRPGPAVQKAQEASAEAAAAPDGQDAKTPVTSETIVRTPGRRHSAQRAQAAQQEPAARRRDRQAAQQEPAARQRDRQAAQQEPAARQRDRQAAQQEPAARQRDRQADQKQTPPQAAASQAAFESHNFEIGAEDAMFSPENMQKMIAKGLQSLDNYDTFLRQETDGQYAMVMQEEKKPDKQITGQLSLTEIMSEWEKVKRDFYENNGLETDEEEEKAPDLPSTDRADRPIEIKSWDPVKVNKALQIRDDDKEKKETGFDTSLFVTEGGGEFPSEFAVEQMTLSTPYTPGRAGKNSGHVYLHTEDSIKQLTEALSKIFLEGGRGNVEITGDEGSGTLSLARELVRRYRKINPNFVGQIAKSQGIYVTRENMLRVIPRMPFGALIIERASMMSEEGAAALAEMITAPERSILIILIDRKGVMDAFLSDHPRLREMFPARVDIAALSVDTLLGYAREYAGKQQCEIDEYGISALQSRILSMQTVEHSVTLEDIRDIVDEAIYYASRKTISSLVDSFSRRKGAASNKIVIRDKDFLHY